VLELAVLGLLKEKPMSGYELQKQLTAKLGAFWRVSFGSLYPCLKRLSGQGAIAVLDPPEPVLTRSRKKHVYQLTELGEGLFHEMLSSTDVHDLEQDRFPLRLAFFRYLKPEMRLDQLERRRGYLQRRLADLRASMRSARDRMDAYTLSLLDHGLEEREREIAWLDRLIAAERVASSGEATTADAEEPAGPAHTDPAPELDRVLDRDEATPPSSATTRRAARRARRDSARDSAAGAKAATKRPRAQKAPRAPKPAEGTNDTTGTQVQPEPGARTESEGPPASAGAVAQTRRQNG
jgi:DNA-binding PadR family transcriptional regulator